MKISQHKLGSSGMRGGFPRFCHPRIKITHHSKEVTTHQNRSTPQQSPRQLWLGNPLHSLPGKGLFRGVFQFGVLSPNLWIILPPSNPQVFAADASNTDWQAASTKPGMITPKAGWSMILRELFFFIGGFSCDVGGDVFFWSRYRGGFVFFCWVVVGLLFPYRLGG